VGRRHRKSSALPYLSDAPTSERVETNASATSIVLVLP
jgi:hypothetical protein